MSRLRTIGPRLGVVLMAFGCMTTVHLGCGSDSGSSAMVSLGFTPSNVNPADLDFSGIGDVDWGNGCNIDQGAGFNCDLRGAKRKDFVQSDNTKVEILIARSFRIEQTVAIAACTEAFQSPSCAQPLVLVALDKIDIVGTLQSTGGFYQSQGGFVGTSGGKGAGPGGGNKLAGGSFCGQGGSGSGASASGPTYGTAQLSPLIGGSAGGAGDTVVSGSGGGALQLIAGKSITINGAVNVGGGGGYANSAGGSGGALLLEAPQITITGVIAANGGGGGGANGTPNNQPAIAGNGSGVGSAAANINGAQAPGTGAGGGGAGRIRINTTTGAAMITGTVSPALSTPCVSQGKLQ